MDKRRHAGTAHSYYVVIGPTADANAVKLIKKYLNGDFGKTGSRQAKIKLIQELKTDVYPIQTCICTNKALSFIKKVSECRVV